MRTLKAELLLACLLFAAGVLVSGLSWVRIRAEDQQQTVQATPPLRGTQQPDEKNNAPAEAKPGERPTTPAPEPAHPDPQTQGAAKPALKPTLPSAPAEKFAPPIKDKQGSD